MPASSDTDETPGPDSDGDIRLLENKKKYSIKF